jgi:hypothetical protein
MKLLGLDSRESCLAVKLYGWYHGHLEAFLLLIRPQFLTSKFRFIHQLLTTKTGSASAPGKRPKVGNFKSFQICWLNLCIWVSLRYSGGSINYTGYRWSWLLASRQNYRWSKEGSLKLQTGFLLCTQSAAHWSSLLAPLKFGYCVRSVIEN